MAEKKENTVERNTRLSKLPPGETTVGELADSRKKTGLYRDKAISREPSKLTRYEFEEGDNTKYMNLNLDLFNLPNIDMNDNEQVQWRLQEYFAIYAKYDTKPTVAGMAMALNGHSRPWLWAIVNDAPQGGHGNKVHLPQNVTDSIKKAYGMMEVLWESYMQNGKVNPVTGIFLGKNNFGYQDKTEHVVSAAPQAEDYNAEEIRQRYIQDDEQKKIEGDKN